MSANLTVVAVMAATIALQTPPPQTTPPPTSTTRPAGQTTAPAKPGSLVLTITNEKGDLLADATVAVRGGIDRGGTSGSDGTVTLQNMPPGIYRCRITRDGYFTLDKEVTIKAATRVTAEAMLSAAPPPPPPPPPPPVEVKPAEPAGPPGVPDTWSLVDLILQMEKDPQPVVEHNLGCAHQTSSKLILARNTIAPHQHADVDELIYVIAGDATLTLGPKTQTVSAASFVLVPRGVSHSLTRKSGKEIVVLSVQSGQACGKG